MPLCSVCGKPNREQARFCGYCGRPLQSAPPELAEEAKSTPKTASAAPWLRQVPGFRSGTRWKQIVAAVGYSFITFTILGGAAFDDAALLLLGVDALVVVLLATNVWSLRSRVPPFNSPSKLKAASGWGILFVVGLGTLGVVITAYNRALETNSKDAGAYYSRGLSYFKEGDYDRAIADFDQAINCQVPRHR